MELKEIVEKIEALEGRANELLSKAEESDSSEEIQGIKAMVSDDIMPEITALKEEREKKMREEEVKALRTQVTTLGEAIEELRKPLPNFAIGSKSVEVEEVDDDPYASGEHSFFADIKAANKGRQGAIQRIETATGTTPDGKAMTEGVGAQGGYLVQKQIERQIVEVREQDNVLRDLVSKINVTTTDLQLDQLTLGTAAGWTAELATKTEATSMTLTTVSASVFTAAGLATISNQLLADSSPAVDRLVTADLAKRIVALEETAFIAGSGTGQPLGLLNTPGLQATTLTSTSVSADGGLLDSILDAIGQVQAQHGEPTAILMHPRTWTRILKSKDAQGTYLVGPDSVQQGRATNKSIFGVRVVTSNRVPTNLGATTNESRVVVGDFSEALILDRQGITVDESPHVYFTSNQTVFRAEARVGFTAARAPLAFSVIGGAGLANG